MKILNKLLFYNIDRWYFCFNLNFFVGREFIFLMDLFYFWIILIIGMVFIMYVIIFIVY